MDWGQIFSVENVKALAWPVGLGLIIIVALYFLRRFLYVYIHRLAAKTTTQFDDILVRDTRLATFLWCIWIGIWIAYKIAVTPESWIATENKVISVVFVAFGIYTLIVVVMAVLKWYKVEICPRTTSSLDEYIMNVLIFSTPVVGAGLGAITVLNMLGFSNDSVNAWINDTLPSVAFLVILAVVLLLLTILIVPKVIFNAVRNSRAEQTEEELQKRADTLTSVTVTTLQVVIIFIFVLMIIPQIDERVSIAPVLTGAGVLGLAVGFGAQSVVKDVLAGLFIIMENQYRKGDVIKIAGETGTVEEINLRRTILRDMDGVYHVVPNGQITVASNYTKQLSRINLNIGVSYDTDLDQAISVINRVGKEMAADPFWGPRIISPPRALRIDNLGDSSVDIKIVGETKPSQQWDVAGELRLRIKKAFDQEKIEIPWPHTKVYFGNQPPKGVEDKIIKNQDTITK